MDRNWDNRDSSAGLNATRLYWHCFNKGIQLGSVIGGGAVLPIICANNWRTNKPIDVN